MKDNSETTQMVDTQMCERLALAMQTKGLSVKKFAKLVGASETTVSMWLSGDAEPRSALVPRVAGTLSVSVRWLLTGEVDAEASHVTETPPPDPRMLLDELLAIQNITNTCDERLARIEKRLGRVLAEGKEQTDY
ncbi:MULTISPECIES: helix-turn-helix domain-containing protein [unclassified Roseovarius]|uniref:helix-turn-helix domain-containing protein n=1 Tax=unclassified Roseovarius TaxID=2614913 RepID=UPI00273E9FCA|nr:MULTISPECIES: helix-turn-helix transcriptional regulator [unclassified Roseovarius]